LGCCRPVAGLVRPIVRALVRARRDTPTTATAKAPLNDARRVLFLDLIFYHLILFSKKNYIYLSKRLKLIFDPGVGAMSPSAKVTRLYATDLGAEVSGCS